MNKRTFLKTAALTPLVVTPVLKALVAAKPKELPDAVVTTTTDCINPVMLVPLISVFDDGKDDYVPVVFAGKVNGQLDLNTFYRQDRKGNWSMLRPSHP